MWLLIGIAFWIAGIGVTTRWYRWQKNHPKGFPGQENPPEPFPWARPPGSEPWYRYFLPKKSDASD